MLLNKLYSTAKGAFAFSNSIKGVISFTTASNVPSCSSPFLATVYGSYEDVKANIAGFDTMNSGYSPHQTKGFDFDSYYIIDSQECVYIPGGNRYDGGKTIDKVEETNNVGKYNHIFYYAFENIDTDLLVSKRLYSATALVFKPIANSFVWSAINNALV